MDIVVDIDGTLADIRHRRHYVASKPKNWKAFNAAMHLDTLNCDVAWTIRALWVYDHPYVSKEEDAWVEQSKGVKVRVEYERPRILLASGRGEESREVTETWLKTNKIWPEITDPKWVYPEYPLFTYHRLYMRAKSDNRSDVIVKREILDQMRADGYDPKMAFDDRDGVVAMWREAGLRCMQVNEGNF
jgi:hypothetical protein